MKKTAIILTLCIMASITSYAQNGGALTINAKVIDEVRAIVRIDHKDIVIFSIPFENGSLNVELPEEMDSKLLTPIGKILDYTDVEISNENANAIGILRLYAFKNNVKIGYFEFSEKVSDFQNSTSFDAYFLYVDTDVKITGTHNDRWFSAEYSIDLNLKKGWNMVYTITKITDSTFDIIVTTQKPDIELQWHFEELKK